MKRKGNGKDFTKHIDKRKRAEKYSNAGSIHGVMWTSVEDLWTLDLRRERDLIVDRHHQCGEHRQDGLQGSLGGGGSRGTARVPPKNGGVRLFGHSWHSANHQTMGKINEIQKHVGSGAGEAGKARGVHTLTMIVVWYHRRRNLVARLL